jgi:hypothetical protein
MESGMKYSGFDAAKSSMPPAWNLPGGNLFPKSGRRIPENCFEYHPEDR